jgi:hypothetical protein
MAEVFLPSKHGFHFSNDFPNEPDVTLKLPLLGEIPIGNAANGLCGGMAYSSLDYFLARKTIPSTTTPPAPDDALFKYIFRRLWDSFDIPFGVMKYYTWMAHHGTLVAKTLTDEFPRIQNELQDRPVPIGFIRLHSTNPMDLGKNHQVLLYDLIEDGDRKELRIYDCNYADDDTITITSEGNTLIHSVDGEIRGLFKTSYQPQIPE